MIRTDKAAHDILRHIINEVEIPSGLTFRMSAFCDTETPKISIKSMHHQSAMILISGDQIVYHGVNNRTYNIPISSPEYLQELNSFLRSSLAPACY